MAEPFTEGFNPSVVAAFEREGRVTHIAEAPRLAAGRLGARPPAWCCVVTALAPRAVVP
jgi:hypothetical protein